MKIANNTKELGPLWSIEAIDSFQKSLNINPFYTEAYYQLATTHLKANNNESARQSMEKAIKADPGNLKFQELYNKRSAS